MDEYEATVAAVRDVGPDTVAIDLETPAGFDALPGQFVLVHAQLDEETVDRYYTVSSPTVGQTFEITVGVDPDGDVTPWLAARDPGDTLAIAGPLGEIYYDDDGDVLVVAGGPGVGPAVAIAERAVDHGHDVAIVYEDDGFAHEDRLDALADAGADRVLLDATAADREHALVDAVTDHAGVGDAYVFGFADFCATVRDALRETGKADEELHVESFG
jgi:ferredoxin-NADP reductase